MLVPVQHRLEEQVMELLSKVALRNALAIRPSLRANFAVIRPMLVANCLCLSDEQRSGSVRVSPDLGFGQYLASMPLPIQ